MAFLTAVFGNFSPPALNDEQLHKLAVQVTGGTLLQPLITDDLKDLTFMSGQIEVRFTLDVNQTRALLDTVNSPTGTPIPADSPRFIFATGNVDAGRIDSVTGQINKDFLNVFAVDRSLIFAGLDNFDQKKDRTVASDIRAFLRKDTALGLTLFDSGLYVVNTANGSQGQSLANSQALGSAQLLHADFGVVEPKLPKSPRFPSRWVT